MSGKSSRRKGHDWERDVARQMRDIFGDRVKRGWQVREGTDAPDVDGTPFWIECKKGKKTNIRAALLQAQDAAGHLHGAGDNRPPLAVCKDDGMRATATMYLDDFLDLVKEWEDRGR